MGERKCRLRQRKSNVELLVKALLATRFHERLVEDHISLRRRRSQWCRLLEFGNFLATACEFRKPVRGNRGEPRVPIRRGWMSPSIRRA
jgi:hypothetical protein